MFWRGGGRRFLEVGGLTRGQREGGNSLPTGVMTDSGWLALSGRLSSPELSVAFFSPVFYEKGRGGERLTRFTHPQPVIICLRKKFDLPF